jgi:hypothetical protein
MKTIVWDIDDVLNDCTKRWLENSWLPAHPDCRLSYEKLTQNPPHRLLGVSKTEYLDSLDGFRLSSEADKMVPDDRVMRWFKRYGTRFRHIALTARPRQTVSPAIVWMLRHYSDWFQAFCFVPAERPGEPPGHPDRKKRDFLSWLGKVDYFIDDSATNIDEASHLGIHTFLLGQPWNSSNLTLMDILKTLLKSNP